MVLLFKLPLACWGWLVMWVLLRLRRFDLWLTGKLVRQHLPAPPPVHYETTKAAESPSGTDIPDLETIILKLSTFRPYKLDSLRRGMEDSEWGRHAVEFSPGRHLYAVKRPTKAENLKRIENVFHVMPEAELEDIRRRAKVILDL